MEIRLMNKNEIEQVREIMFKTLSRKNSNGYANSNSSFTVVADLDSEIVGVATVFIHENELLDEKTYFVSNLCVLKEYQRLKIATKMMDFIEKTGKKNGIKYIYTLVPIKYSEANKLYEKLKYDIKNINCYRKELC